MEIITSLTDKVHRQETIALYKANNWAAANKPEKLLMALNHSHSLVTAKISGQLIGLGNAISDGHLVVYFPHMLVHPDYHREGIGSRMLSILQNKYIGFHQQMLTADSAAVEFYSSMGFKIAGDTQSMWIYDGDEH